MFHESWRGKIESKGKLIRSSQYHPALRRPSRSRPCHTHAPVLLPLSCGAISVLTLQLAPKKIDGINLEGPMLDEVARKYVELFRDGKHLPKHVSLLNVFSGFKINCALKEAGQKYRVRNVVR